MNPLKPEEIGRAYDELTHLWTSPDFNRNDGIQQHLRAIAFAKNKGAALDVGCGCSGRIIDLMLAEGYSPEGIDVSNGMLKLAETRHPNITFHHADICKWVIPKHYDLISAWDSIWHVPLSLQAPVLLKLFAALNRGGICIFTAGGLDNADEHCDAAMGREVYYSTLGVNGFLDVISQSGCICRHFEYDQQPELHSYFIVQKL